MKTIHWSPLSLKSLNAGTYEERLVSEHLWRKGLYNMRSGGSPGDSHLFCCCEMIVIQTALEQ